MAHGNMTTIYDKPVLSVCGREAINAFMSSLSLPGFRTDQLWRWLYRELVLDPEKMLDLPKSLRLSIQERFICCSSVASDSAEAPDGTRKLLIGLSDGERVEMAIIPSQSRTTFCLSTQVGCPVRCGFCASGIDGLTRNMTSWEILEQVYHGAAVNNRELPDNLVFMGIGEGLFNFDHLAQALEVISSPDMIGMSPRRITVSTSGHVPGIEKLTRLGKPFTLALSLHATDDATRARIIPDGSRFPLAAILKACDDYRKQVGRMVTFEYTLLKDINDFPEQAERLARLAKRHHAKVNLIPYNQAVGNFERPARAVTARFRAIVEAAGATVTLRQERGTEITAACGQLRAMEKQRHRLDSGA